MNPLAKTDAPAIKVRRVWAPENERDNHTIAVIWEMIMVAIPNQTNDSANPPATAASPVALELLMPMNA